ncbi:MAG TPA: XRE family transcriptional regulator [Planctomycetota bacterium]|nr:XRE family transcriptional regulator [Planctomycetota bacterium]
MNLVELAQRIRTLRQNKKMTLEQVASATGLTRSWLSKVENFRVTPSLPALGAIAEVLDVPVSKLLEGLDQRPQFALVRHNERRRVDRDAGISRILYDSLAHKRPGRRMDPFLLTVPTGVARKAALGHEGEEFLLVIAGPVDFEYDGETHRLETGDAAYFDAHVKHRLHNPGKQPAQVLSVFLAPELPAS